MVRFLNAAAIERQAIQETDDWAAQNRTAPLPRAKAGPGRPDEQKIMDERACVSALRLGEAEVEAAGRIIGRIREEYRARGVFLVESCGRHVISCGENPFPDSDAFASLIASVMAAVAQLSSYLEFRDVGVWLQKGGKELLYIEIAGELILIVLFGRDQLESLEKLRARLRTKKALGDLAKIAAPSGNGSMGDILAGIPIPEIDHVVSSLEPAKEE